ncbi:hypothetical protein HA402_003794 [Bradysia odoriphaga]|nr:hypothetical protein HA402_003794 [Bradysia odoriphaga]
MVIGDNELMAPPQQMAQPASIDNIMSGISNTGTVKMNNHRKKLRQRFDIIKKLGQGTYGKVQLGINKETSQEVAIKTIKKCKIETDADLIRIRREVQIMSSVQHPNIIHIYEVFENREKMVLVMEFAAGGELYDYLSERKVLAEDEARRVFRQISTAVYYCHKHKICHRDLKLENILLDEHGNAKVTNDGNGTILICGCYRYGLSFVLQIADFGLSNVFDDQRLLATFCGSPLYASPEIVKGTPYQGPEVDCWSLGVLLYTLVYGAMPFDGSNFKRLVKQISAGDYYEPKNPSPASPLIKEMLTVCPQRRATIEQICNHWWVNTGYTESCLDLAEELANQTPVRLDVLLSLTPSAVTSDQLVVPGPIEETKSSDRVARSHSVGSIREMGSTEAERRILDMVAAGGEAALAPSPTRTITSTEPSPAHPKRKLETTVSTENAVEKKREKPLDQLKLDPSKMSINEEIEVGAEPVHPESAESFEVAANSLALAAPTEAVSDPIVSSVSHTPGELKDLNKIEEMCDELCNESLKEPSPEKKKIIKKKVIAKTSGVPSDKPSTETSAKKSSPTKITKKVVNKTKTTDLVPETEPVVPVERKNSLPDEDKTSTERRRSKIFETAEKFQSANQTNSDKLKKIVIPGVSVGSFKKEFERKASLTSTNLPTPTGERKLSLEKQGSDSSGGQPTPTESRKSSIGDSESVITPTEEKPAYIQQVKSMTDDTAASNDSKSSLTSFSLEEARRSMENSIALLNQAKTESNNELDQLCDKTKNFAVSDDNIKDRQEKLKSAREIIGNAIPVGRMCMGVRKPPVPFGLNGRSVSGSVVPSSSSASKPERRSVRLQMGSDPTDIRTATVSVSTVAVGTLTETPESNTTKTSRAEIVLKSATLPRRKTAKTEIQLDTTPKNQPPPMRFQTEMQHIIPDLRSAPIQEHSTPYIPTSLQDRATSLEPQQELIIPIQRPGFVSKQSSGNTFRSGSLSRQSTNDSDTDITSQTQSVTSSNAQPIKKSPREFIIPIAVEGGGFVTPRAGSLEPSESTNSSFNHIGRPRKISSILSERDSEDESPFHKLHRHTSIGRESENDDPPRFAMHRLRTTRPLKKMTQNPNDSGSSGEDDDEDGFEILTAENLFSTLLSRVRALTNRLNVNNEPVSNFPSSRFMSNLRQTHSPFWNHDPFGSRLNNGSGAWRHSMSRDLTSDIDSMFSRTGATLPRGIQPNKPKTNTSSTNNLIESEQNPETLDLADLDLSRLRLTKKDLETLSSITPDLPKHFQDQLLAQLPPNQARKLSRTLSMQNNSQTVPVKVYKRSLSGGREDVALKSDSSKLFSVSKATHPVLSSYSRSVERDTTTSTDDTTNRNFLYRRSFSGSKDSRSSSSRCVNLDECNNHSPRSSHSSEISDKYKTYHSNSSDTSSNLLLNRRRYEKDGSVHQSKYYDTLPPRRSITSPSKEYHARPPSGCLSPPPPSSSQQCDSPVRRRPSQRRISRFLRPDFFDVPQEESCYVKDRKERDLETQNILKKIRERSRERSLDRREKSAEPFCERSYYSNIDPITMKDRRKSSIPNLRATSVEPSAAGAYHMRTKSENKCCDLVVDNMYHRRRSLSKPNENYNIPTRNQHNNSVPSNSSFADRILSELQNISMKQIMVGNDDSHAENSKNQIKEIAVRKAEVKDIPSVTHTQALESTDKSKKVSKLARPKSYPSKEQELGKVAADKTHVLEKIHESTANEKTILRPKSYPTIKIASAKEIKCSKNGSPAAEEDKTSNDPGASRKIQTLKSGATNEQASKKTKNFKKNGTADAKLVQLSDDNEDNVQSKAPEKKQKTGFLYSIGQKFEKLRENSKNKVLRKSNNKLGTEGTVLGSELTSMDDASTYNNKHSDTNTTDEKTSSERKSRIDTMIRNLRERSVTRGPVLTESGLIKRAVSVEDLSDTFNKCSVNKVLGLFKKFESSNVQNTKSSSIVDSIMRNEKERPKSSEYISKQKNGRKYSGAKSDTIVTLTDLAASSPPPISLDRMNGNMSKIPVKLSNCRDFNEDADSTIVTKRHSSNGPKQTAEDKERMRQNRKGLVLDFNKIENGDVKHALTTCKNNNNNINNGIKSNNNNNNNDSQTPLHPNGVPSPSYDSLTNYSSDSRSIHDDCASTSTFLSPTDEPELYFDDWSICSEDNNFTGTTPSPSLSRLSRNSQSSLLGDANNSSESVIDRIKRRSFYCRFNENKTKRQSNIVGPAAREYYREAAAKLKSRPPDRVSPTVTEAHEYYRQLKQKQNSEQKASHRHSEYLLPKSNLNLNLPLPTSSSSRRISTTDNDYKYGHSYLQNGRSSVYDPSSLYATTYHSKIKPSSYTTNGASCLDSYATMGRKPRAYENRSKSLMDSSIISSANSSTYRRDHRGTVDYGTLTRPSIRYRTSSISRSPTNL